MKKSAKLNKIYAKIPEVNCKGLCHDACSFVQMLPFEGKQLKKKYGNDLNLLQNPCPKLVNKRCSIYKDRPFVCRIYGAAPSILCPFGCKPKRMLTSLEARKIFIEADKL